MGAVAKVSSKTSKRKSKKVNVDELILEHRENGRKLARSILRRWRVRMNLDEVDSIVDLTLCEAAQRFSPEKGASFMTFYFYHLRGQLVRAVSESANNSKLVLSFGVTFGDESLNQASIGEELCKNDLNEQIFGKSYTADCPENRLLRKEDINLCKDACEKLDELEQEVLYRSYAKEEALVDIARSLGYSRCHISRVKKRALERLGLDLQGENFGKPANDKSEEKKVGIRARRIPSRRSRRRTIQQTKPEPIRATGTN